MKILRITGSMDPARGGISQSLRNIIYELLQTGTTCEIACVDNPDSSFLESETLSVHALGPSKTSWQYAERLLPWLSNNITRFDICIIDGLWIYPGYATWKAVKILNERQKKEPGLKVPAIYIMPHGMLDPYFQTAPGRTLKAIRNRIYWRFFESKIVNEASGVLFTCNTELQLAKKTFTPYKPKKQLNVGLGIELPPDFDPKMKGGFLKKNPGLKSIPYILFLGRIDEKKGVDLLINAYKSIFEEASNDNRQIPALVIAGPGLETSIGKKITNIANSIIDLKKSIFFPGMLTGDEKWGALYGCEAFILPSHQENFGVAVVEAMACGKAVLISDQVNIADEINAGGGAIVAPDTLAGTTELLNNWLKLSAVNQQKMGVDAFNTFNKKFNIKSLAPALLKAITN